MKTVCDGMIPLVKCPQCLVLELRFTVPCICAGLYVWKRYKNVLDRRYILTSYPKFECSTPNKNPILCLFGQAYKLVLFLNIDYVSECENIKTYLRMYQNYWIPSYGHHMLRHNTISYTWHTILNLDIGKYCLWINELELGILWLDCYILNVSWMFYVFEGRVWIDVSFFPKLIYDRF